MRQRYRFLGRIIGREGDRYIWESVLPIPGDSRHEQIMCPVEWFWAVIKK
jgi:hypothetical protein